MLKTEESIPEGFVKRAFPGLGIPERLHSPASLRHLEAMDSVRIAQERLLAGERLTDAERNAALDGLILRSGK